MRVIWDYIVSPAVSQSNSILHPGPRRTGGVSGAAVRGSPRSVLPPASPWRLGVTMLFLAPNGVDTRSHHFWRLRQSGVLADERMSFDFRFLNDSRARTLGPSCLSALHSFAHRLVQWPLKFSLLASSLCRTPACVTESRRIARGACARRTGAYQTV